MSVSYVKYDLPDISKVWSSCQCLSWTLHSRGELLSQTYNRTWLHPSWSDTDHRRQHRCCQGPWTRRLQGLFRTRPFTVVLFCDYIDTAVIRLIWPSFVSIFHTKSLVYSLMCRLEKKTWRSLLGEIISNRSRFQWYSLVVCVFSSKVSTGFLTRQRVRDAGARIKELYTGFSTLTSNQLGLEIVLQRVRWSYKESLKPQSVCWWLHMLGAHRIITCRATDSIGLIRFTISLRPHTLIASCVTRLGFVSTK